MSPGSLWRVFGRAYLGVVDAGHAYYRPVVAASYALDARWSGVDPRGYHLTNVLLYALVAALACELLRALQMGTAVSLAGGVWLAVHPALVPAVAWIPGRNDSLLALFALAAWLAFARDAERPSGAARAAHFAFFGLALFTKETALALPIVWLAHARLAHRARLAPYLAGWIALIALRLAARRLDAPHDAAGGLAAARLFVGAIGKVALPFEPTTIAAPGDVPLWPGVIALGALGAAALLVRGARRRVIVLGAVAFAAPLLPVAALGGSLVLDCRLVLPACGALVALAEIVRAAVPSARQLAAGAAAVLAGLAALSAASESALRSPRAFALAAVAASPRCALAHLCLGRSYQAAGEDDRALAEYQAALALGPAEVVHNNVAVLWMKRARWEDAERELDAEIAINPRYARAYANKAIVLRHEGRPEEAAQADARARELGP